MREWGSCRLNSERVWCSLASLDPHAQVRVLYARKDPRDEPCQLQQRLSVWTAAEQCRARPSLGSQRLRPLVTTFYPLHSSCCPVCGGVHGLRHYVVSYEVFDLCKHIDTPRRPPWEQEVAGNG